MILKRTFNKSLHSENKSKRNSVYKSDCNAIKINVIKTLIFVSIKKKLDFRWSEVYLVNFPVGNIRYSVNIQNVLMDFRYFDILKLLWEQLMKHFVLYFQVLLNRIQNCLNVNVNHNKTNINQKIQFKCL